MKQTFVEKILWTIFDLSEVALGAWDWSQQVRHFPPLSEYPAILRALHKEEDRRRLAKFISYLKKKGYIKEKFEKNKKAILLTPKGLEKVFQINLKQTHHKERPDKKWQMVIFDIPEKFHKTRDQFRKGLKILGYKQLQQSVWVAPHDVLKETEKLIRFYGAESWIKHFLIEKVEIE